MKLQNRVFLVTGAASGLGLGVVETILQTGGKAVLLDRSADTLQAVAEGLGTHALAIPTDVTDGEAGQAAVDKAINRFGRIDGLINCAGIAPAARIIGRHEPHDLGMFSTVVAVNLVGTFNMMCLAACAMAKQEPIEAGERGVIVNTASIAAFDGQIGQAAYAASKGGVAALTLPAARDLARHGIRVVAIAPGIFETPMMKGLPSDVQSSLAATVPFPSRLGQPADFAALVRHIIENPMLNGEIIRLDGPLRMPFQ